VRVVDPDTLPEMAMIVAVPTETPLARPLLSTIATDVSDEIQVTLVVISGVVPSEYVPTAVNCWGIPVPTDMLGLAGVTSMEIRVGVTVRVADPDLIPELAMIVAVPIDTPFARPLLPTVATGVLDELQVT
jgi:hypothetical protein